MPGSPWMPSPTAIRPLRHGEQRLRLAGQGAAVEGDAERPGAVVGAAGQPLDLVEGRALLGGGAGDLEDREVAGDAAALLDLVRRGAPDVVGDQHGAAVDALGLQLVLGGVEVQHVTGVVAVAEQHPAALVGGLGDGVGPLGGRRGEQVAHGRAVGQAGADEAGEGRVVPGPAADHDRHRGLGRPRGPDHAAGHGPHPAARGGDEALDQLVQEVGRGR